MNNDYIILKKNLLTLIKNTKKYLADDSSKLTNDDKGICILAAVATSNSLYENFIKKLLTNTIEDVLNSGKTSYIIFKFKYINGKSLDKINFSDINDLIDEPDHLKINICKLKNDMKTLSRVKDIMELYYDSTDQSQESLVKKILHKTKFNLSIENLCEQLTTDYGDKRTNMIHGDYKDLKTIYFIQKDQIMPMLYRIYLVFIILNALIRHKNKQNSN